MFLRAIFLACLFIPVALLRAEHLPGGSITYECLGGNTYTVTLTLYRECSGEAMIPQALQFSNDCGVSFTLGELLPLEVVDVSPICNAQAGNSNCNGGSLFGVERYTYQQTLFLSPCDAWTIAWFTCCRQSSINVDGNPGLYIAARLNNQGGLCTNSPQITDPGLPVVCVGESVVYDPGIIEVDGHSFEARFIEASFATPAPIPVIYTFPYFGLEPFTGMTIDAATGVITFTPTLIGSIVVAFQVDEFDADGNWIGSVMRDFPFTVQACSNAGPLLSGGQITGVSGAGSSDAERSLRLCDNGPVCFDLEFTDPDAAQALSLTTNVDLVLPGATVTTSGTNPLLVTICWDSTQVSPFDRNFTMIVSDDACPVPGTTYYTYRVRLEAGPDSLADGSALACPQTGAFALMDSLGIYPQQPGTWTDPSGAPHPGLFQPATDPSGTYTFTVELFPGCATSAVVDVTLLPPDDTLCSLVGVEERALRSLSLFPNPTNGMTTLRGLDAPIGSPVVLRVHDVQGRTLLQRVVSAPGDLLTLDLGSMLAPGAYLLRVESASTSSPPLRFTVQR